MLCTITRDNVTFMLKEKMKMPASVKAFSELKKKAPPSGQQLEEEGKGGSEMETTQN